MLLDYEAIRYHLNLRLRKKKHKTPFSEYFAQVFDNKSGKPPEKLELIDTETPEQKVFKETGPQNSWSPKSPKNTWSPGVFQKSG